MDGALGSRSNKRINIDDSVGVCSTRTHGSFMILALRVCKSCSSRTLISMMAFGLGLYAINPFGTGLRGEIGEAAVGDIRG